VRGAFSASLFAVVSATLVWTLGWVAAACVAVVPVAASPNGPTLLALGVAVLMAACGCWVTAGLLRTGRFAPAESRTPPEPWFRRVTGWLAVVFWCSGAVVWNIGVIGWLVLAADEGRGWVMLVLIPWSLVGWFLLVVLFASVGVMIDTLLTVLRQPRV
jgi:hypothetical protein